MPHSRRDALRELSVPLANLRALLSGGDRRSIAQSNRARALIEDNPALVGELAALTADGGGADLRIELARTPRRWFPTR